MSLPTLDQASGLRSLMGRHAPRLVVVVTPFAAGAGRIVRPLAVALARQQRSVLVVDEAAPATVFSVAPDGGFAPAAQGSQPYVSLDDLAAVNATPAQFVLVDAHAGSAGLSPLAAGAHEVLVAVHGNETSGAALTAAYACIKGLHARHALSTFRILVLACGDAAVAQAVFQRLAAVASRYLTVTLTYAGYLPAAGAAPVVVENAYAQLARSLPAWAR